MSGEKQVGVDRCDGVSVEVQSKREKWVKCQGRKVLIEKCRKSVLILGVVLCLQKIVELLVENYLFCNLLHLRNSEF